MLQYKIKCCAAQLIALDFRIRISRYMHGIEYVRGRKRRKNGNSFQKIKNFKNGRVVLRLIFQKFKISIPSMQRSPPLRSIFTKSPEFTSIVLCKTTSFDFGTSRKRYPPYVYISGEEELCWGRRRHTEIASTS